MPSDAVLMSTMQKNALEIRRLHQRIHDTSRTRDRGPNAREAWQSACAEFHRQYDRLAFPGGYAGALDRILSSNLQTIDAALCFVQCRPYFYRSGYMFKDLLRKLKRAPMDAGRAKRLQAVLKAYADYRNQRRLHRASGADGSEENARSRFPAES